MKKKNAVIYARYSSSSQRDESIEDQIADCTVYAERRGYNVINVYSDKALSGTTDHRPNFLKMIDDAKQGQFKYIICYKTDRFARSRYDAAKYKEILKECGVKVVYSRMDIPTGPEGIILEGIMESLDEYYSANLSQNIKRGQHGNALKAMANGVYLFGYDIDESGHYVINDRDAEAVKTVFEMVISGYSDADIINWLNSNNYRTSRNTKFTKSAVVRICKNRKYIGEYKYGSTIIPDGMPAIVSEKTFNLANDTRHKTRSHKEHAQNADYLLSGLLYCGSCGGPVIGVCGTSKNGKRHYYYQCSNSRKKKCKCKAYKRDDLEKIITAIFEKYIFNNDTLNDIADAVIKYQDAHNDNHVVDSLKADKMEKEKALSNIINAIEAGAFSERLSERMKELENEINDLDKQIAKESLADKKIDKDFIVFILKNMKSYLKSDSLSKKKLFRTFVDQIFLFEDHVVMTFNYTKNGNTASLTDVLNVCYDGVRFNLSGGANGQLNEHLSFLIDNNNVYYIFYVN